MYNFLFFFSTTLFFITNLPSVLNLIRSFIMVVVTDKSGSGRECDSFHEYLYANTGTPPFSSITRLYSSRCRKFYVIRTDVGIVTFELYSNADCCAAREMLERCEITLLSRENIYIATVSDTFSIIINLSVIQICWF